MRSVLGSRLGHAAWRGVVLPLNRSRSLNKHLSLVPRTSLSIGERANRCGFASNVNGTRNSEERERADDKKTQQRDNQSKLRSEISGDGSKTLYLHVGPSGDYWTGDSIFAAKHLQPDYVRSVSLADLDGDSVLEILEEDELEGGDISQKIYDTSEIPNEVLTRIEEIHSETQKG